MPDGTVLRDVLTISEDNGIIIRSDIGTSEDEKQKCRGRSFRKKAMTASKRLRYTLRRRGKRAVDRQRASVLIHEFGDLEEEKAVRSLTRASLYKDIAFHQNLSTPVCAITKPEAAAARVLHFNSRSEKSALGKSLKNFISYVINLLLLWILNILASVHVLFQWLERYFKVICTDKKSKNQYLPLAESESQVNYTSAELDDLLWKKLLYLESLVMELYDSENHPEQEDMFLESMNRIICIEYDLQKTKKALRNTASKQVELNESLEYFLETSLTVPNSCWLTQCKSLMSG